MKFFTPVLCALAASVLFSSVDANSITVEYQTPQGRTTYFLDTVYSQGKASETLVDGPSSVEQAWPKSIGFSLLGSSLDTVFSRHYELLGTVQKQIVGIPCPHVAASAGNLDFVRQMASKRFGTSLERMYNIQALADQVVDEQSQQFESDATVSNLEDGIDWTTADEAAIIYLGDVEAQREADSATPYFGLLDDDDDSEYADEFEYPESLYMDYDDGAPFSVDSDAFADGVYDDGYPVDWGFVLFVVLTMACIFVWGRLLRLWCAWGSPSRQVGNTAKEPTLEPLLPEAFGDGSKDYSVAVASELADKDNYVTIQYLPLKSELNSVGRT